jgi:hypothetical protein
MRKYATLVKATEVALRSEEGNPRWRLGFSLCITLRRCADSIRMSARRGRPWAQGVPPGKGVERSTKTLTHPAEGRRPKRSAEPDEASPKKAKAT